MRRQAILVLAIMVWLSAVACKNEPATMSPSGNNNRAATQSTPDQFAAVRGAYEKNCKQCHGANADGGPVKLADGTRLKVPSLREGHALHHPDSDFVKQITKGGDGMPAFGEKLKPEEITELIRFIRQEFQGGRIPTAK